MMTKKKIKKSPPKRVKKLNLPKVSKTKSSRKKPPQLNLPKAVSSQAQEKALKQKFTTGYYHCLANNWGTGKITDCCSECKEKAQDFYVQRNSEIEKLGKAYRQMGDSLVTLLRPLRPPKH